MLKNPHAVVQSTQKIIEQAKEGFPRTTTDVYPTRYKAFASAGQRRWVVFTPVDGMYRCCTEDAIPVPVDDLGVGVKYPGEVAVLYIPQRNDRLPELVDGVYVVIGGREGPHDLPGWGYDKPREGFIVDVHWTLPTYHRPQANEHLYAPTLDKAMWRAERWLAVKGRNFLDKLARENVDAREMLAEGGAR